MVAPVADLYEGIDGLLRAQNLDEQSFDRSVNDALLIAFGIADQVADPKSPLTAYAKIKREALIEALKALPDIRPTDVDSVMRLQRSIEQYRDLVAFLTTSVQQVQSLVETTGDVALPSEDMAPPEGELNG